MPSIPFDFEANARDGAAIDWLIRYEDLAPWYSYVEKFVGISGNKDGLETFGLGPKSKRIDALDTRS